MGTLIQFPDSRTEGQRYSNAWETKPVEQWTPYDDICEARAQLARLSENVRIAEALGDTMSVEYIVDSSMLGWWRDELSRLSGNHECEIVQLHAGCLT